MNDDELERLLSGAFDAKARSAVPERARRRRCACRDELAPHRHRQDTHRSRWLAPLAAAAAVLLIVGTVFAISQFTATNDKRVAGPLGPTATGSRTATQPRDRNGVHGEAVAVEVGEAGEAGACVVEVR